jgi:hypothetical protein
MKQREKKSKIRTMNKFKLSFTGVIFAASMMLMLSACKNELDINADYEDINIVYSVLDPSKQRQYIRINRAFLTEGNAIIAASEPDSSNYPFKLKVYVTEYDANNQLVRRYGDMNFLLDTVFLASNPSSVFNVGLQPFYYFDATGIYSISSFNSYSLDTLFFNPKNKFRLKIENPVTGEVSESETTLIDNFSVNKPASNTVSFVSTNRTSVEMKSPPNAKVFDAKFIFFFREFNIDNPSDTLEKQVTWNLGTLKSERITGGEDIFFQYIPHTFFSILNQRIPKDPMVKRLHGRFVNGRRQDIQLVITAGAFELSTYIDANKPSSSVIQDKPVYTNINNGIGIFSSKRTVRINYHLNVFTVDSLRNSQGPVPELNFQ